MLALALATPAHAATITVNTTADELDFIPNDKCSLREAVVTVNEQRSLGVGGCSVNGTLGSADEVVVPAGVYRLTRITFSLLGGVDQDADNLDLLADVTLRGAGAGVTIVDGDELYYPRKGGGLWPLAEGGVVRVGSGVRASVEGVTLRNGWATYGGGAFVAGALTLRDVAVEGNTAEGPGGGLHSSGALTLNGVTVSGNLSDDAGALPSRFGGGIYSAGTLDALNVTLSGNRAVVGGGLYLAEGSELVTLSSVTISDNEAVGGDYLTIAAGGGVVSRVPAATVRVENSLIAGNRGAPGAGPDCDGAFDSFGFNLVGNASDCSGFDATGDDAGTAAAPLDPLLAALADYGGRTRTHALLPGSPAIDGGPLGIQESCPATDQRGFTRANDGDANGFVHCDVGAYEAPTGTATGTAPEANLEIFLFDEPDPVGAGGTLTYNVSVRNNGPAIATGVHYELVLPEGSGAVTDLPGGCDASGLSVTCDLGDLDDFELISHLIDVVAPTATGPVIATATVTSTSEDPDPGDDSAQTSTRVVSASSADLALVILGPSGVELGGNIEYILTATNAGPSAADANARVTSFLPTGTTFVTASAGCTRANAIVTCPVPGLAVGESRALRLTVTAPTRLTTVTLTGSVAGDTGSDGDIGNNSASWSTRVQAPPPPSADLFIQKLGPSTARVDAEITYRLIVNNNGPDTAEDVRVTDTLPVGTSVVSLPDACEASGQTVTCDLGAMELGALQNLPVVVRAPAAAGAILNAAGIEDVGGTVDPYPVNDQSSVATTVTAAAPPPGADLTLSKSAPLVVQPGAAFDYALVVTNNGPDDAVGVELSDVLPTGVGLVSTPGGCAAAAATLTCEVGALAAGSSASFTVPVRAPQDQGELTNTATVTSDTDDPVLDNDQDSAITSVSVQAPGEPPTLRVKPHPDAAASLTAAPGDKAVVALRFEAVAGASEAVNLQALNVRVAGTNGTNGIALVALYPDADDDGAPDSGAALASGAFAGGSEALALTVAGTAPAATVPAAGSSAYLIVVDVGAASAPSSSAPGAALAALVLAPFALALRRRKARLLLLTLWLCASGLVSCRTAVPDTEVTHQLVIESVSATGSLSGVAAEVSGVPLAGAVIVMQE